MIKVLFDRNAKNQIRIEFAASGVTIFEGNKIDVSDIVKILSSTNHSVSYVEVDHVKTPKTKKARQVSESVDGN